MIDFLRCRKCGVEARGAEILYLFYRDRNSPCGFRRECRECYREDVRLRRMLKRKGVRMADEEPVNGLGPPATGIAICHDPWVGIRAAR